MKNMERFQQEIAIMKASPVFFFFFKRCVVGPFLSTFSVSVRIVGNE